jgi:ABC-type sugar transport system substrate-binding protein
MKQGRKSVASDWLTRLLVTAVVVAMAALLAGPAAATVENERSNNGWYTGLEYEDLPRQQPAVQNEYSNNGWYTGLEYEDMPQARPAAADDGFPWEETTISLGAAVAALLVAASVVASRSRNGRVATD